MQMSDEENTPIDDVKKELTGKEKSLANLKQWGDDNPPPKGGRKLGSLNRTTLFQKWLEAAALKKFVDKIREELGEDCPPLENVADLLMARKLIKALDGSEGTIDSLFDNLFGKLAENANINNTGNISVGAILQSIASNKPTTLPKVSPQAPRERAEPPQQPQKGDAPCIQPKISQPLIIPSLTKPTN